MLINILETIDMWLSTDSNNVVAVHCKVHSYLLNLQIFVLYWSIPYSLSKHLPLQHKLEMHTHTHTHTHNTTQTHTRVDLLLEFRMVEVVLVSLLLLILLINKCFPHLKNVSSSSIERVLLLVMELWFPLKFGSFPFFNKTTIQPQHNKDQLRKQMTNLFSTE
jgi:hypothetical protein